MRRCRSSRCRHFYPRPPRGGRRSSSKGNGKACKFLSTPSARRATHLTMLLSSENHISIHALREEGDPIPRYFDKKYEISIHALREEGDQGGASTPTGAHDFYPRPPRGGRRDTHQVDVACVMHFYPRPPRGGRHSSRAVWMKPKSFLSTPSARRATLPSFY